MDRFQYAEELREDLRWHSTGIKRLDFPTVFIDGKDRGGANNIMAAEGNGNLFYWLDNAKVNYVKDTKYEEYYPKFF